jgi:hypothetical protein
VIDVSVREDDGVDLPGADRKVPVSLVRLGAPALVQPAVQQDPVAPGLWAAPRNVSFMPSLLARRRVQPKAPRFSRLLALREH